MRKQGGDLTFISGTMYMALSDGANGLRLVAWENQCDAMFPDNDASVRCAHEKGHAPVPGGPYVTRFRMDHSNPIVGVYWMEKQ